MNNLSAFNKQNFLMFFSILFAGVMLQGCGGQRDEPFDPGETPCSSSSSSSSSSVSSSSSSISSSSSSSSSSSCSSSSRSSSSSSKSSSSNSSTLSSASASSAAVEISLIGSGTKTNTTIETAGKKAQVVTESEFNNITGAYSSINLTAPVFTEGQVFLIDDGDVNGCDAHFEFQENLTTKEVGDNGLKVLLDYREKPSKSPCTPSVSPSRPYYFYYIKSKKLLAFEDNIVD